MKVVTGCFDLTEGLFGLGLERCIEGVGNIVVPAELLPVLVGKRHPGGLEFMPHHQVQQIAQLLLGLGVAGLERCLQLHTLILLLLASQHLHPLQGL